MSFTIHLPQQHVSGKYETFDLKFKKNHVHFLETKNACTQTENLLYLNLTVTNMFKRIIKNFAPDIICGFFVRKNTNLKVDLNFSVKRYHGVSYRLYWMFSL